MIGHGLTAASVIAQDRRRQAKLRGHEGEKLSGYCIPVLQKLRERHPRVAQKRELQSGAKPVPLLSAVADDGEVGRLEGVEPRQQVAVPRDTDQLLALSAGEKFMLAFGHARPVHRKSAAAMDEAE